MGNALSKSREDFLWKRTELINGKMFVMDSPSMTHQEILGEL